MGAVEVRVGATVDSGIAQAMAPIIATARRARAIVQSEAEQAATAQTKAADKAAKGAQKAYDQMVAAAGKAAAKEVADADKAAQARTRADLKAFDAKIKASQRAADEYEKTLSREVAATEKAAAAKAAAEERANKARQKQAGRDRLGVARDAAGTFGRIAGAAGRLGMGVAQGAGVNLDIGSQISSVVDHQKVASQIVNSGYLEGAAGANGTRQSSSAIYHEAREAAKSSGLSTSDTLGGLQAMVGKSSDLETSRALMGDMARLSAALGANMTDVGEAAGEVSLRLGDVPHKAETVKNIMGVLAQQGKVGAIEMKSMAINLATVLASAGKFASGPEQAAMDLGALFQAAKKGGSKNAAASATGVQSFVAGLTSPAELKRLSGMGINVFANKEHTLLNDPGKIIAASLLKTGGDLGKLGGAFKNTRAMSVVSGLGTIYGDAEKNQKGSGVAAIEKYFKDMGKGMSGGDLAASLKESMDTTASKANVFNVKLEEMGEKLGGKLFPALEKLEPVVEKSADAFVSLVGAAVDNPGAAITAAIVYSIGKAAVGSVVGNAIKGLIGGGGVGGAGGGGAGAVLGAAVLGVGIGVSTTAYAAGQTEKIVDQHAAAQDQVQEILAKARAARAAGTLSKEDEAALQQQAGVVTGLNQRSRNAEMTTGFSGVMEEIAGAFGNGALSQGERGQGREDAKSLEQLHATQEAALAALRALATGTLKVQVTNLPTVGGGPAPGRVDTGAPGGT